jgi:hypothetical protein
MRYLLILFSFLLGLVAGTKAVLIEHSGDGEDEVNIYVIIGFVNVIPANFNDNSRTITEEEDEE